MMETVLVLVILTIGSLWYAGRRAAEKRPLRRAGELLPPRVYGALLVLTMILVLLWR